MNAYEERQERRRQRLEARAERLAKEAQATYGRAREMASAIPFGQPVLVGHYSEGRDRNFRAQIGRTFDKAFAANRAAGELAARAEAVGSGGISSDDPDAIKKLREKVAELEANQAKMKAANAAIKKGLGVEDLIALGFSEKDAIGLMNPVRPYPRGFASFSLSNNSANIRRVKLRIAQLERNATREPKKIEREDGVKIVENVEANRLQLFFPGKPSAEVRAALKSSGFRWSPSEGAWQRQLNNAARWAAEFVLKGLSQ